MVTERLQMIFQSESGGRNTVSILDPKPDLTEAEVQSAMQTILTANIFETNGGDLASIVGARVVRQEVTEFNIS